MRVTFHAVDKNQVKGFVIDITLPRSSRFDPLTFFGDEKGVAVSAKHSPVVTHYRLGVSDNKQFARMLNALWEVRDHKYQQKLKHAV